MKSFLLALLFPYLSWQLPYKSPVDDTLQRRAGAQSLDISRVKANRPGSDAVDPNAIQDTYQREKYLVPVTVEGQTFNLELDTGSADLWIIQSDFTCYTHFNKDTEVFSGATTEDVCNFGDTYTPGSGFAEDPDLHLLVAYGDGTRAVEGPMGEVVVTIGDISVKQLIAAPNESSFPGYGPHINSGVMGVGIASLTQARDTNDDLQIYESIIETIFDNAYALPQFSLALSRDDSQNGNGGIFTIGGLPDNTSAVNYTTSVPTTAKLQILPAFDKTQQTFYAINIDNFVLNDATYSPDLLVYIDSGDYRITAPADTAKYLNYLWSPPLGDDGSLSCDAYITEPIGVAIGGRTYYMESRDLVGMYADGTCYTLIEEADEDGFYVLGDPFLKNVLAVFDYTYNSMEFYPRQYYES